MDHFYNNIQGYMDYEDLYTQAIQQYSRQEKGIFVEVGAWLGRSIAFLTVEIINSGKDIDVHVVDKWEDAMEFSISDITNSNFYSNFLTNIEPVKDNLNIIRAPSIEAASKFIDNSIDFLFLDAAHTYKDVTDDFISWWPKMKNGGIFAGHDYYNSEVGRAVNDFCEKIGAIVDLSHPSCFKIKKP
jgi:hypothetical protein